ncbi:LD-carboxypeptidase [Chryseobacterium sp. SNU WT5]|uniref:S66 peptidase family protein n=1 Tax=Chryseobacterium sp. SNU WT5 TaxID=2594269 RepID=UPI00117C4281|nr:LD-carboxypeptidase [Chryseobacterium sp. SNU WT5]QDP85309.1 LD-carboxypeptidase [Chryseobacterium sp. SNU WT5]
MKEIIFPESLKKGDQIAVISPAGAVDVSQLQKGFDLIKERGFEPVLGKNLFTKYAHGYSYAGTEKERISDMNWAFNNPDIAAIWASRGGYGCQHLLKHLKLNKFHKKPKWYIGYSDNTVVQRFLLKNNYASIHGQTLKTSSFGVSEESYDLIFNILKGKNPSYSIEVNPLNKNGQVEGQVIGGNLALIYALLGTSYNFDFKDKILFIEEVGEKYYALDRMIMSLELAGVFRKIKGLIIGGMTNMGDEKENRDYEESYDKFAYQLISERLHKYNFPTLFGFPNGHIFDNKPLIIGANAHLTIGEKCTLQF